MKSHKPVFRKPLVPVSPPGEPEAAAPATVTETPPAPTAPPAAAKPEQTYAHLTKYRLSTKVKL